MRMKQFAAAWPFLLLALAMIMLASVYLPAACSPAPRISSPGQLCTSVPYENALGTPWPVCDPPPTPTVHPRASP